MTILTQSNLAVILARGKQPNSAHKERADKWFSALSKAMQRYDISTKKRIAAFLAQIIHESAAFTQLVENLNYSAAGLMATWPKRFDTLEKAKMYERSPERIANFVYGGRNGNNVSGDGWLYRGRGLIQVTFKENYRNCGNAIGYDLLTQPELLERPEISALSAGWYWDSRNLNQLADFGDMVNITKKINGGINGLSDRLDIYDHCLKSLPDA